MIHSRQKRSPWEGQMTGERDRARQSLQASKERNEVLARRPFRVP